MSELDPEEALDRREVVDLVVDVMDLDTEATLFFRGGVVAMV